MPTIVTAALGERLCEALGVDPHKVARIELDFAPGDIATATVTFLPDATEVADLMAIVEGLDLDPIEVTTPKES